MYYLENFPRLMQNFMLHLRFQYLFPLHFSRFLLLFFFTRSFFFTRTNFYTYINFYVYKYFQDRTYYENLNGLKLSFYYFHFMESALTGLKLKLKRQSYPTSEHGDLWIETSSNSDTLNKLRRELLVKQRKKKTFSEFQRRKLI